MTNTVMSIISLVNKEKMEIATDLTSDMKILPNEGFPQPAWMTLRKLKKCNNSTNTFPFFVYMSAHKKKCCFYRKEYYGRRIP